MFSLRVYPWHATIAAQHVTRAVLRVARAVDEALHPDGVNLIQANRRAAFQSVFHFHMHVIARWWDDGIAPSWKGEQGDPQMLRETAETIRDARACDRRESCPQHCGRCPGLGWKSQGLFVAAILRHMS